MGCPDPWTLSAMIYSLSKKTFLLLTGSFIIIYVTPSEPYAISCVRIRRV